MSQFQVNNEVLIARKLRELKNLAEDRGVPLVAAMGTKAHVGPVVIRTGLDRECEDLILELAGIEADREARAG